MRPSAALCTHWLACLKSAQLQHIARATGIQSSGTKGVLVERIAAELRLQSAKSDHGVADTSISRNPSRQDRQVDCESTSTGNRRKNQNQTVRKASKANTNTDAKPWSILSIDMGIQNLAFAHLRVPRSAHNTANPVPELTAWHRLAVSDISSLNLTGLDGNEPKPPSQLEPSDVLPIVPPEPKTKKAPKSNPKEKAKAKVKEKESFSPDLYAATAYSLLASLLTAYRPTHILIERQRFRTGGASAVQEWTLRVGVFEGMLYAILHALRMERGDVMVVNGVEPKRVVRYWLEAGVDSKEKEKEKLNAREVKKAKIDLVGRWLGAALDGEEKKGGDELVMPAVDAGVGKIGLAGRAEAPVLHGIVGAYLRRWKGTAQIKRARTLKRASASSDSPAEDVVDLGKLDDLADCLLQGVAWIEWQAMRERIAREGLQALGVDGSLEIKPKRKSGGLEKSIDD